MSAPPIGVQTANPVILEQKAQRLDPPMALMLALAERAQVTEGQMESMIDQYKSSTQRIKDFTALKAALQELDGLCNSKKPDENIKSVLDANPALKDRIDSLSAKLGIQPFESTTATDAASATTTSSVVAAEEDLPTSVTPEVLQSITPEALKFLTDAKARGNLMKTVIGDRIFIASNESRALEAAGGPVLLKEVRDFLNSPAGKDLANYTNRNGDRGDERLRQEIKDAGGAAAGAAATTASATEGVIPKSQIQAAITRIQGECDQLGSNQHIETMRLNQLNTQRTGCFEGMSAQLQIMKQVSGAIYRS